MLTKSRKIWRVCASVSNYYRNTKTLDKSPCLQFVRGKKDDSGNISQLVSPVPIKPSADDINVGLELTGTLDKGELLKVLNKFTQRKEIRSICMENGLDGKFFKYYEIV